MGRRSIIFNSYQFNTNKIIVQSFNPYVVTDFTQDRRNLGPRNGQVFVDEIYKEREVEIVGKILGSSKTDADNIFETMKSNVEPPKEAKLEYDWNGRTHNLYCKAEPVQMRYYRTNERGFRVILRTTTSPYAEDSQKVSSTTNDITDGTFPKSIYFAGTAPPTPIIKISFDSVNNTRGVTFRNNTTKTEASVEPNVPFSAGDTLEFNAQSRTVAINGDEVFYTNSFPDFVVGVNDLVFTFDSDSQQYDFKYEYNAKYL